jgi:hypothetical protein
MAIPVSIVPKAIAAIMAAVKIQVATDPNATTIALVQGDPGPDLPVDIIAIGTRAYRRMAPNNLVGSGSTYWLNEDPVITSLVSCYTGADDPVGIQTRAYQLVGYIETAIRTDPSLGGLVDQAYPSQTDDTGARWVDGGRLVEITVDITISKLN